MRPRPRVTYDVHLPPEELLSRFSTTLEDAASPCSGSVGREEVTLYIAENRRRPWSPWLQLAIKPSEGGAKLVGVMGPQPNLWTAFVFVYACFLVIVVSGTMYGFVQFTLDDTPTGLTAALVGLIGLGLSCGLDLLGRNLGEGQMGIIRGFVTRTVPEATEIEHIEGEQAEGPSHPI